MNPATLASGLSEPVHDAQRIFRAVLDAMSRPARPLRLDDRYAGLDGFAGVVPKSLAAALLSLTDFETPVWLEPTLRPGLEPLLRFHAGAALTTDPQGATFAVASATALPPLDAFAWGSAEYPDRSTTLLIVVEGFAGGESYIVTGPGIASPFPFAPLGLPPSFWRQRREMQAEFPCGVDCLLFDRDSVAALPRTTVARPPPEQN
jgi:alpha-D-ribose 1-methylphosphonate 5-triphosphate synthase subunit PhnH